MKGKYPKDFKWTGWHPNDLCYVIPIIKTEEQFWLPESERGKDNDEITDVPQGFKTWVANNQDRIARAEKRGTLPYFVRDNRERVGLTKEKSSSTTSGGMKGGQHLGRKEEKEAYIAYNKKENSVTTLTDKQIENRNQLAEMLGIRKEEILPFMPHEDADAKNPNSPSYILSRDCTLAFHNASAIIVNPKGKQLNLKMINGATKEQGRYFFGWDKEGLDGHIIIAERMKDKSLVFYDPQDGSYWSENDILKNTMGYKVTSMRVDNLLLKNAFVKNLMRIS